MIDEYNLFPEYDNVDFSYTNTQVLDSEHYKSWMEKHPER